MNFPINVEELKNRLIPTKEEVVLIVLTYDLSEASQEDYLNVTDFILKEIGFSSDDLPVNTFVKFVIANRPGSEKLVEYYRMRLRNYLNNKGLKGSVFLVCGERWSSSIPL